ncbi:MULTISPECIES: GMP/IMP nucleotidase [Pantoea]|jgi:putative hydrolase of the HAD superfamily|uniref:GMP/IMP nucleotidase n=1 Tax=Pantoea brenneri TaxID=472694 RepID=A0A7Y6NFP5_9GAMM|nr:MULTISPECIES: GMP/IMP nucleotidase [Pantoea]KKD31125.1 nucleotidase [Pantoea sp. 3.5.1]MBZ6396350.1 GMP/IMP nucleotidase [Pantoea sp.]MBZ6439686.1 GMP/IMP nucleotidase [Pantoea sp.]MDU4127461.1 GMP/IMP nucleotidase [Pantoea sp.]NUY42580.1 GMP/IMP nucleotidase [Pantoea brenneri]
MIVDWSEIDTVLLDMDGTLLDLAFDRHFWLEHVPAILSQQRGITPDEAEQIIAEKYQAVAHTLNWYCLDYWAQALALDIRTMTWELRSRVALRADTLPFLQALRRAGKRTILLTNAHPYNLDVKLAQTGLAPHLDLLLSTHTFGYPKEDQRLWQAVQQHTGYCARRTLFIDDSEVILDAAKLAGIGWCLGVSNPDSGRPEQIFERHVAVSDYQTLI